MTMTHKSQISRAELLYWIDECNNNDAILEQSVDLLGFRCPLHRRRQGKETAQISDAPRPELPAEELKPEPVNDKTIPKVSFYYLAHRERYASEEEASKATPPLLEQVSAIADDELDHYWQVHPPRPPLSPMPLANKKRLSPFLGTELRQVVGKRLDVKKLVQRIAYQQPLYEIPTQPHLLPAGRVTVIADLNPRLLPFWEDIDAVCALIKQKHGKIGLDCRVLAKDEPRNDYYQYDDWRKKQLTRQSWRKIPAQSLVIIISDLGQLAANNSLIYQRWLHFVQRLNRRGIQPIVFAPIAAERQCPQLQALTQQILWQATGHFRPTVQRGNRAKHQAKLERMIAFLSLSPHIEPILLRALCQLLPITEGHSGVEADIYLHVDIQWGYTSINVHPERREHYQALFKKEDAAIQQQVFDTIQQHHSGQFPSVWAETILNAETLMFVEPELVEKAEQLMLRFAKRYYAEQQHQGLQQFARRHLKRLKQEQHKKKGHASAFYGLAYRQRLLDGEEIPAAYDKKIINQLLKQFSRKQRYQLQQRGNSLLINVVSEDVTDKQLTAGHEEYLAEFSTVQNTITCNQKIVNLPSFSAVIGSIDYLKDNIIHIDTGKECLTIKTQQGVRVFDELVLKYQQKVINLALRFVRDHATAMDIAQEAFIKAYQELRNFRESNSAFYTWLYRITINIAKNHVVSQSRRLAANDIDVQDAEQYSDFHKLHELGTPDREMEKEDMHSAIIQAIKELPDNLRIAITLREIEGFTYEQISEAMECSISITRSRIFRAREFIEAHISR